MFKHITVCAKRMLRKGEIVSKRDIADGKKQIPNGYGIKYFQDSCKGIIQKINKKATLFCGGFGRKKHRRDINNLTIEKLQEAYKVLLAQMEDQREMSNSPMYIYRSEPAPQGGEWTPGQAIPINGNVNDLMWIDDMANITPMQMGTLTTNAIEVMYINGTSTRTQPLQPTGWASQPSGACRRCGFNAPECNCTDRPR